MRAPEVAQAHQEFVDDFPAREPECGTEELHPRLLRERVMGIEPAREGPVARPDGLQTPRVLDRGLDLQSIADDARIGHQALYISGTKGGDAIDIEAAKCGVKGGAL